MLAEWGFSGMPTLGAHLDDGMGYNTYMLKLEKKIHITLALI